MRRRDSLRLKGYDYSCPGWYYITICTQGRACLFGEVLEGQLHLNEAGRMIKSEWSLISSFHECISVDLCVVMPEHFHGVLQINCPQGVSSQAMQMDRCTSRTDELPLFFRVVGRFKSATTNRYIQGVYEHEWTPFHKRLWQRGYYERIIRDEVELCSVRRYILENPARYVSE
jgi:REP element-mobilizing transposase RayT